MSSADDLHKVLNCGKHLQAASGAITGSTIASAAYATRSSAEMYAPAPFLCTCTHTHINYNV